MKEKKYKFDLARLISLWLLPTIFIVFVGVVLFFKFETISQIKLVDVVVWTLFLVFTVGFFLFLFLNHLAFATQTELIIIGTGINNKKIQITQGDTTCTTSYNEIQEIIEYSTDGLPWSSIIKWEIVTSNNQITISSLTISKYNFKRYFWDKINQKPELLPII